MAVTCGSHYILLLDSADVSCRVWWTMAFTERGETTAGFWAQQGMRWLVFHRTVPAAGTIAKGQRRSTWEMMGDWTRVVAVEVGLTGQILHIFYRYSQQDLLMDQMKDIWERDKSSMTTGVWDEQLEGWHSHNCNGKTIRRTYLSRKTRSSVLDMFSESSINIKGEMLNRQMNTQVYSSGGSLGWGQIIRAHQHRDFFNFSLWKILNTNKTRKNSIINPQVPIPWLQQLSVHGQSCLSPRITLQQVLDIIHIDGI